MLIHNPRSFPQALAFGEHDPSRPFLAVIIKGTFALTAARPRMPALLAERQLPVRDVDEPYDPPRGLLRFELDRVPWKPRADIVLVGDAHAPRSRPAKSVNVEIQVGATEKTLAVFGDRRWSYSSPAAAEPTPVGPVEFVRMPLIYDLAFGGVDRHAKFNPKYPTILPWYPRNSWGRGYIAAKSVESIHEKELPNIENASDLIQGWSSYPFPAGCGFFPRAAQPRVALLGTYDDKWRAERAPRMPEDFSFASYNGAHPDLQVEGYLKGNEPVRLTNVTPGGGAIETFLPGIAPSLLIERRAGAERPVWETHPAAAPSTPAAPGGAAAARPPAAPGIAAPAGAAPAAAASGPERVTAHLDTLVFVPEEQLFYQVWRAIVPLAPDAGARDIEVIYIDYADLPAAPWPAGKKQS